METEFQLEVGQTYELQDPPGNRSLPSYLYVGMKVRLVCIGAISLFVESPFHQILAVPHGSLIPPVDRSVRTEDAPRGV